MSIPYGWVERLDVRVTALEERLRRLEGQTPPPETLEQLEELLTLQDSNPDASSSSPPGASGSTFSSSSVPSPEVIPPTPDSVPSGSQVDAAPTGAQGGPARVLEIGDRVERLGVYVGQRIGRVVGFTEAGLVLVSFAAGDVRAYRPDSLAKVG